MFDCIIDFVGSDSLVELLLDIICCFLTVICCGRTNSLVDCVIPVTVETWMMVMLALVLIVIVPQFDTILITKYYRPISSTHDIGDFTTILLTLHSAEVLIEASLVSRFLLFHSAD